MSVTGTSTQDFARLLMRLMLGVVFVFHGAQKLFGLFGGGGLKGTAEFLEGLNVPLPMVSAVLAGSAEFFGGLALILGLYVRLAVIPMVFTMLVGIVTVHNDAFNIQKGGMEYALTLGVMLVVLGMLGPGSLTAKNMLRRGKL